MFWFYPYLWDYRGVRQYYDQITISTVNDYTDFDTVIEVTSFNASSLISKVGVGNCSSGFSCLTYNDDDDTSGTLQSQVTISTDYYSSYWILVRGFDNYTGNFELTLDYTSTSGKITTSKTKLIITLQLVQITLISPMIGPARLILHIMIIGVAGTSIMV